MLERIRQALVLSYVGAIGLGSLLANCVQHLAYVFSAPLVRWLSRDEYQVLLPKPTAPTINPLRYALPELVRVVVLSLVWYWLFRWLYLSATKKKVPAEATVQT